MGILPGDRIPPFGTLRAFEAAARHLSFTKAADELALTQSAVSRQVKSLEADLNAKLAVAEEKISAMKTQAMSNVSTIAADGWPCAARYGIADRERSHRSAQEGRVRRWSSNSSMAASKAVLASSVWPTARPGCSPSARTVSVPTPRTSA